MKWKEATVQISKSVSATPTDKSASRTRQEECFLSKPFLNYLLLSEGDDGLSLKRTKEKQE